MQLLRVPGRVAVLRGRHLSGNALLRRFERILLRGLHGEHRRRAGTEEGNALARGVGDAGEGAHSVEAVGNGEPVVHWVAAARDDPVGEARRQIEDPGRIRHQLLRGQHAVARRQPDETPDQRLPAELAHLLGPEAKVGSAA